MSEQRIAPSQLAPLSGTEELAGGTVLDFWRWALGDLRMNTARGYLAEYLVARAVRAPARLRVEWDGWDVTAADKTKIEVKASGYLQSWSSMKLSTPRWQFASVNHAQHWSHEAGAFEAIEPRDRVDVWVFALQTCQRSDQYDPLDLSQWAFRLIRHSELLSSGQASAGISFFDRRGIAPVGHHELARAIAALGDKSR